MEIKQKHFPCPFFPTTNPVFYIKNLSRLKIPNEND